MTQHPPPPPPRAAPQARAMSMTHAPRGECPIVKLTRESRGGWDSPAPPPEGFDSTGGVEAVTGEVDHGEGEKRVLEPGGGDVGGLRFGVVVMCDGGMWPEK